MNKEIPEQIAKILTEGETVQEVFEPRDCKLYATNKRLIAKYNDIIRDFDYRFISSISYGLTRQKGLILAALGFAALGIAEKYLDFIPNDIWTYFIWGISIVFFTSWWLIKTETVTLYVLGLYQEKGKVEFPSNKALRIRFESLLYLIRAFTSGKDDE